MATKTFTDYSTIIDAEWCNDVDAVVWDVLGGATTDALALTALGVANHNLVTVDASGNISTTGDLTSVGSITANNNLTVAGYATVGTNLTVNGNTTLGNAAADTVTFNAATLTLNNTVAVGGNLTASGTITSTGTVDVSGATLTLANDQISGDKIHGGSISNFASTGIDDNAASTVLTIDGANNILIGAGTPATQLHLLCAAPILRFEKTGGAYSQIDANSSVGSIELSADKGNTGASTIIQFAIDNAERARFDSSGNFALGTTSAQAKFHVQGTQQDAAQTLMRIGANNSSSQFKALDVLVSAGTPDAILATAASGTDPHLSFAIGSSTNVVGRFENSTGDFYMLDGATERVRLLKGAGGIKFPATQAASSDANTLDDYEEGTFTPVIYGSTTSGTGTYTQQTGRYLKVGNTVFITLTVSWTGHTGTGDFRISGLPFTSASGAHMAVTVGQSNNVALSASNTIAAIIPSATSEIYIQQVPVGGGDTAAVPIDTAGALILSAHYNV